MAELNKYHLYNYSIENTKTESKDKVDLLIDEMIDLHIYSEVKDFVERNFGEVQGIKWFEYPELNKKIYVLNEEEKVEICTLKNDKQYYGKGWKHIIKDKV